MSKMTTLNIWLKLPTVGLVKMLQVSIMTVIMCSVHPPRVLFACFIFTFTFTCIFFHSFGCYLAQFNSTNISVGTCILLTYCVCIVSLFHMYLHVQYISIKFNCINQCFLHSYESASSLPELGCTCCCTPFHHIASESIQGRYFKLIDAGQGNSS